MATEKTTVNLETLVAAAREARQRAYVPYSSYPVGAALITREGKVFTGCNIENAAYPATICAERVAITKAVSEGYTDFVALAVVTENAGSPCGICRQVMNEFAPDMLVVIADGETIKRQMSVSTLLPLGFGPDALPRK